jgi:hypothetical protein
MEPARAQDRFLAMGATARALLSDFREVDQSFRDLDRSARERIATWSGGKGALLDEVLGGRDVIGDSAQGRSFRAFWDFLMTGRGEDLLLLGPAGSHRPRASPERPRLDGKARPGITP